MIRAVMVFGLAGSMAVVPVRGQAPAIPKFDVASVKPNSSGSGVTRVSAQPGGRFVASNATPMTLILNAFRLQSFQVIGAPAWMTSERYDVNAVAAGEIPDAALPLMVQALLAERFNLKTHLETRPLPIYALVRTGDGRPGPNLRPWDVDCAALRATGAAANAPPADPASPPVCGMRAGPGRYLAGGEPIAHLASSLASELSTPVVDETKLPGLYSIALRWNPDPGAASSDGSVPSLFTALQEQLGLRLESRRVPTEVLVVDAVTRPTPD